jgi:hypothetical protein
LRGAPRQAHDAVRPAIFVRGGPSILVITLTIEETFRDEKDLHFGLGLSATHIKDAARRDRLLFLVALAHALLTLLGAASEETGLDRTLKANTSKKRTHSLFRQGSYWYHAMPNMRDDWFENPALSR